MQISVVFEPYKFMFNHNVGNSVMVCVNIDEGPIGRPIAIGSVDNAVSIYGNKVRNIIKTAYYSGIVEPNVFLTRLNGTPATCLINGLIDDLHIPMIRLHDANNGATNNGKLCAYINQKENIFYLLDPFTEKISRRYDLSMYPTVGNLVDKINIDASYYSVSYLAESIAEPSTAISAKILNITDIPELTHINYYLSDGKNTGMNVEGFNTNYSLYNYPVSSYALDGYYYGEEEHINYIKIFNELCYEQNTLGNPVIGVIECKPKLEDQTIDEYIDMLEDFQENLKINDIDLFKYNNTDIGAYIVLVCGSLIGSDYDGIYEHKSAVSIASMISTMDRKTSLINKSIKNVSGINISFTPKQIARLVSMKINPLVKTISGYYGLMSSITCYNNYMESNILFESFLSTRIGQEIVYRLSKNFETSSGLIINAITIESVKTKLKEILDNLIIEGYLKKFEYEVIRNKDELYLNINYMPVSEIEFVNMLVRI